MTARVQHRDTPYIHQENNNAHRETSHKIDLKTDEIYKNQQNATTFNILSTISKFYKDSISESGISRQTS